MLRLIERGIWYSIKKGKNSRGVNIPTHSIGIAVKDAATLKAAEARRLEVDNYTEWPHKPEPKPPEALTLLDAYTEWLNRYKESSTRRAYASVHRLLVEPMALQQVTLLKDVTSVRLDALQLGWKNAGHPLNTINTWRKYTSCMFNYCVNHHATDLDRNPWKPVEFLKELKPSRVQIMAGKSSDKGISTMPLDIKGSNANWLLIQANLPAFARGELAGQTRYFKSPMFRHHLTFALLLRLMYETGLRRSDAILFRPDLIVTTPLGGMYSRPQFKTGGMVTCFLSEDLAKALRALPRMKWRGSPDEPGAGRYPFYDGSMKDQEGYMNSHLNRPLRELGSLLGIQVKGDKKSSLRPHRFRDSFAVNMLSAGLSLEHLSRLLGHKDISTTQRYYAHYVPKVQEAVEAAQAAARLLAWTVQTVQPQISVN